MASTELSEQIDDYLSAGFKLLPCHGISLDALGRPSCTCPKGVGCPNPGKHPRNRHGWKDASGDPLLVARWISAYGDDLNLAIATGMPSGNVIAIDLDTSPDTELDGFVTWDGLVAEFAPPATLAQTSGGGGRHLLYRLPPNVRLRSTSGWRPGIDIRADGGILIVAPSLHISGAFYEWENWGVQPQKLPDGLLQALQGGGRLVDAEGDSLSTSVVLKGRSNSDIREHGFPLGSRDDGFNAWIWRLIGAEYPRHMIEVMLWDAWQATDQTGHAFPWERVLQQLDRAEEILRPKVQARAAGYASWVAMVKGVSS